MTCYAWSNAASRELIGCGIDSERVDRFAGVLSRSRTPFPFVFSAREIAHFRGLDRPAAAMCAAFCCKEATVKALGEPIDMVQCEYLGSGATSATDLELGAPLRQAFGIEAARAELRHELDTGETVAVVYLFGEHGQGGLAGKGQS